MSTLAAESAPALNRLRILVLLTSVLYAVVTVGLYRASSWATWLWPWDDARMTFIFFASITAAVSLPLLWIAVIDEPAALAGPTLDAAVIGLLVTIAMLVMVFTREEPRLIVYAIGSGLFALANSWVFRLFHPAPVRDSTPQPRFARVLFCVVIAVLVPLGTCLVLRVENVFPWDLPSHVSTVIGCMFLGASAYIAYGVWKNNWVHTGGQLAGLLAYSAVLAVPYWRTVFDRDAMNSSGGYAAFPGQIRPETVDDVNDPSLFVFTAIITVAGLTAIWYLFLDSRTRVFRQVRF